MWEKHSKACFPSVGLMTCTDFRHSDIRRGFRPAVLPHTELKCVSARELGLILMCSSGSGLPFFFFLCTFSFDECNTGHCGHITKTTNSLICTRQRQKRVSGFSSIKGSVSPVLWYGLGSVKGRWKGGFRSGLSDGLLTFVCSWCQWSERHWKPT